jgi:hypothetical protein
VGHQFLAEIRKIIGPRWNKSASEASPNFNPTRTNKLVVNLDTGVVFIDDQPVHLTGKEYAILELLTLRTGTIVTREMLACNHAVCRRPGHVGKLPDYQLPLETSARDPADRENRGPRSQAGWALWSCDLDARLGAI